MEFTTFYSNLKIDEIKPDDRLEKYFSLIEKDVVANKTKWSERSSCPACGEQKIEDKMSKMGLTYNRCASCFTVFSQQTPNSAEVEKFYCASEARKYWLESLWHESEGVRIEKILKPAVDWIENFVGRSELKNQKFAELFPVNPGFYQVFKKSGYELKAVNPQMAGDWISPADQIGLDSKEAFNGLVLFQALDRTADPAGLLRWASEHLETNGCCFVTGVLSSGLDSLALGDKLPALIPFDRWNSFSYEGFQRLAEKCGFEVVELSTPGALDLQNIRHAIDKDEVTSALFKYLLKIRKDELLTENFTEFLQLNRLSSHLRAVLRKK